MITAFTQEGKRHQTPWQTALTPSLYFLVFTTKNGSIQTIPSLMKRLKLVTEPVIGLQYVWEYRSPSKSVPPHYQCKLCKVTRLQNEMAAHVKGWKHGFRYMKRNHPEKVPHEEDEAVKDPAIRKAIKETTAELEKTEGRGQLRVILKEPNDIAAFQGMRSAVPKAMGPGLLGGPLGPRGLKLGGRFPEPMFPGEFPPLGLPPDFPMDMRGGHSGDMSMRAGRPGDIGGFPDPMHHSSPGRSFQGTIGSNLPLNPRDMDAGARRFPNDMPMRMGSNGFGMGLRNPSQRYAAEFRGNQAGGDRLMMPGSSTSSEDNSLPSTLLKYLDSFRIENENDAQIVLKVTQKLTDVLMEYRLRSVSTGSSLKNSTSGPMSFSTPSSRLPSGRDRYSGSFSGNHAGNPTGPSRFYN